MPNRVLAAIVLLAATACSEPPDAEPQPDASTCPAVGDDRPDCPPWYPSCDLAIVRADECAAICSASTCHGATAASCEAECLAYTFRGSYCPAGAQ